MIRLPQLHRRRDYILAVVLGLCWLASACTPLPPASIYSPWVYGDLRGFDALDSDHPSLELIAIYTRNIGREVQIRLDLLDHAPQPDYDLYLALDTAPGGRKSLPLIGEADVLWDMLVSIPAAGAMQVVDAQGEPIQGSALRVVRDPVLDAVIISLNRSALGERTMEGLPSKNFGLQIFLTLVGNAQIADRSAPLRTDALPPAPIRVLFAFWNTFPSYTPAVALRRWDGAHTGPFGGRHGLFNLLRTAQASNVPLVLLDLNNPASLSALNFFSGLEQVKQMLSSGLFLLPQTLLDNSYSPVAPSPWLSERLLEQNLLVTRNFGLPPSPFLYAPSGLPIVATHSRVIFTRFSTKASKEETYEPVRVSRWRDQRLITIPNETSDQQATIEGPTLELRRALLEAALASPEALFSILILGGDLPHSAWGDPQIARATFRYLTAHPWIHILDAYNLLSMQPSSQDGQEGIEAEIKTPEDKLLTGLRQAPNNAIGLAAMQAFEALFAPVYPTKEQLPNLRTNYLGNIWSLLRAADWASNPTPFATCEADPDFDGENECLMATRNVFTQFEIESGTLTFAFLRTESDHIESFHQIIGPSSQFITGLSEPATWNLKHGLLSDPTVIPGAFFEADKGYKGKIRSNRLVFTSQDQKTQKIFSLTDNGIHFEYNSLMNTSSELMRIPLVLDPWERFTSGWADRYGSERIPEGWVWKLADHLTIQIQASADLQMSTFLDSRARFITTEDPNFDYPSGHFLPFPMALLEFSPDDGFVLEISAQP